MLNADVANEVFVTSVSFTDTAVEFTYFEKRNQQERAGLMNHLIVDNEVFGATLEELVELLTAMVDKGLVEVRNPPATLDPRKRL